MISGPDVTPGCEGNEGANVGTFFGAAIVLRDGSHATDRAIRAFAAERMADFKVPRAVVTLDEIPKGTTGKMQRIGMAAKLGLA